MLVNNDDFKLSNLQDFDVKYTLINLVMRMNGLMNGCGLGFHQYSLYIQDINRNYCCRDRNFIEKLSVI